MVDLPIGVSVAAMAVWVAPVLVLWWREARRDHRQSRAQRRTARARAERLLVEQLSAADYVALTRRGYLEIPSPTIPGRVYRIPRRQDVVTVYEAGRAMMHLCAQPVKRIPDAELVLVHKLMVEGDEREYLRIARAFPVSPIHLPARLLAARAYLTGRLRGLSARGAPRWQLPGWGGARRRQDD